MNTQTVTTLGLMQDLDFSIYIPLSHLCYRPTPLHHVPLHQVILVVTWCVTLPVMHSAYAYCKGRSVMTSYS